MYKRPYFWNCGKSHFQMLCERAVKPLLAHDRFAYAFNLIIDSGNGQMDTPMTTCSHAHME